MQLSSTEYVHTVVHPPRQLLELFQHPRQKLCAREPLTAHRLLPQHLVTSILPHGHLPGLDPSWTWDCTMFVFLGLTYVTEHVLHVLVFPDAHSLPNRGAPRCTLNFSSLRQAALVNISLVSVAVTVLTSEGGAMSAVT